MKLKYILIVSLIVGSVLRLYDLETYPGLHFDEARFGLEAESLLEGSSFPLKGQQPYIGNFYQYFISIPLIFLGKTVFSIRIMFALMGIFSLLLIYYAVKPFDRKLAAYSTIALSLLPAHIVFSRIAWEMSLVGFFFCLSFYCLSKWITTRKYYILFALFLVIGIGINTHMLFLATIIPLLVFLLVYFYKTKMNKIVVIISLVLLMTGSYAVVITNLSGDSIDKKIKNFNPNYPVFYRNTMSLVEGQLIFLRTSGSIYLPLLGILFPVLFLIGCIICIKNCNIIGNTIKMFLFYFLLLCPIVFALFGYRYAIRYYIGFLPMIAIVIGIGLKHIEFRIKYINFFLLIMITLSVISVSVNFFYIYYETNGSRNSFDVGFPETSEHFMNIFLKIKPFAEYCAKNNTIYFYESYADVRSVLDYISDVKVEGTKNTSKTPLLLLSLGNDIEIPDIIKTVEKPVFSYMFLNKKEEKIATLYVIRGDEN